MLGRSNPGKQAAEERQEQREHQLHAQNLQRRGEKDDAPRTLEYLAEIDDGPDLDDGGSLDHLTSKVVSTANLDSDRVDGAEWENEIAMLRRRQAHPPAYGITGHFRAWVKGTNDGYKEPLESEDLIKHEGVGQIGKLALSRSEDFTGVETPTRDTTESIVTGKDSKSSGILGRFRD